MNNETNVMLGTATRKTPMIDRLKYPMEIVQALMDERGIDEKSARRILYNRDYHKLNKDKLNQNRRYYYHEIVKKSPYMLKHLKEYSKKYYEEHKEQYKARSCEMKRRLEK